MSYIEPAEPSWRASKRRRTAITLLVLLALLAAAIYYFSTYWKDEASGRTPCPSTSAAVAGLRPSTITINVLNATKRNGLASKTSTTLKGMGFHDVVAVVIGIVLGCRVFKAFLNGRLDEVPSEVIVQQKRAKFISDKLIRKIPDSKDDFAIDIL